MFSLQFAGLLFELRRSVLQRIGTLIEFAQFLVTFQHLFHVYAHDADHFVDFGLRLLQALLGGRLLLLLTIARRRWWRGQNRKTELMLILSREPGATKIIRYIYFNLKTKNLIVSSVDLMSFDLGKILDKRKYEKKQFH